ncbi:MAG: transcription elongation factor GreA [Planctomycetota bacterium]
MALSSATLKRLQTLASKHELKAFEDAWVEALSGDTSDVDGLLEAITAVESQGHSQKASQFLQLLVNGYVESADDDHALKALRRMAALTPRDRKVRDQYLTVYRRKEADHDGLEALIAKAQFETATDIGAAASKLESYLAYRPGAYVDHPAGWGVGTVVKLNAEDATVTIDFADLKGHELEMDVASNITRHLETDDFKAMKYDRLDQLLDMAANNPVELVKCVVRSRTRATTVRDMRQTLTEGVIPMKDWSKWWTKARTKVKRDPNVKLSTGNNPTIQVTAAEQDFADNTLSNMASLKDLPRKIKYVRELFLELDAHPETRPALLVAAGVLAKTADTEKEKYPGALLSVSLMLEKVASIEDDYEIPPELKLEDVLLDPWNLVDVIDTVPIAADRKEILTRVQKNFEEDWPALFEKLMYVGESDINDFCLKELSAVGAYDRLTHVIYDLLKRFRDHRGSFMWLVKLCLKKKQHKALPSPRLATLLERTLLLHSHVTNRFIQSADPELRKETRNIEKLLTAKSCDFVKRTVEDSSLEEAVDFYNIVRGSRSIPDDVKDTIVAALLRKSPDIAKARARAAEDDAPIVDERIIYVTAAGYERFEADFNRLVNDDIPLNAKEIGIAASFGDLSENAEWTAAIEKQSALTQKADEMREALEKARVIDEESIRSESAQIGCEVLLLNAATNAKETYTLLGPWDADLEKGIISYMAPLGRSLLGKAVGDTAEVTLPGGVSTYKIVSIKVSPSLSISESAG